MPKVWNIGNTTVRNPKRIETALKVFLEEGFSGNAKGSEVETRLHAKLKEREILEFDGEPSDWNGRKWRAAFYQLGFISFERYNLKGERYSTIELFNRIGQNQITLPYQITEAGKKLIAAQKIPEIEDIYTRQFSCYELPNSLESGYPEGKLKPFILILDVLNKLQDLNEQGLNKLETGLFIQKFRDHTPELSQEIVSEILEYRKKLAECKGVKEIRAIKKGYQQELEEYSGINSASIVSDYSDTTFRYFSLSGLFAQDGDRIVIRDNKRDFVTQLLESEPNFLFDTNPVEYFLKYYNNSYAIPTDIIEVALREINILKSKITDKENELYKKANSLSNHSAFIEIQKTRYELIEFINWGLENNYALTQQHDDSILNIIEYLKVLNGENSTIVRDIDDRPAYLEWAVWRSFLAINEIVGPVHETRRFPLDQDFLPRNTAPGGGPDLIFEFETYVLVVEVTLTISHRQMAVESEPVRRHTVQYKEIYPDKEVYCLFIAPSVDNNVAETFRIGVWYKLDNEEFVNIIPMSLSDYINTFETLNRRRFTNFDLRSLFDRCLASRNVRAPQWKQSISREVNEWKKRFIPRA
jgi:hypothetical protein